jgi:hypothetical protein
MTGDRLALIEHLEKNADSESVREMLDFAAARLKDVKAEAVKNWLYYAAPWDFATDWLLIQQF